MHDGLNDKFLMNFKAYLRSLMSLLCRRISHIPFKIPNSISLFCVSIPSLSFVKHDRALYWISKLSIDWESLMMVMYYSSCKMLKYSEYFNIYSIISRIALMICWLFGDDMNSLYAWMILGGRSYFNSFRILVFSFSKNILNRIMLCNETS